MHRISDASPHPGDAWVAKKATDEWDHTRVRDDHVAVDQRSVRRGLEAEVEDWRC